jgi:hypothetical protein
MRSLILVVVLAGCDDVRPVEDDAGPAVPQGQGSEASSDLVINEVAPRGDGPDWIELFNRSDESVDLCGYFLTDSVDRLDHYLPLGGVAPPAPCEPMLLDAGARRIVLADGVEAPFQLGIADEIHLVAVDGLVVDGLLFLYGPGPLVPADVSLARDPDGDGLFFERAPTPGEANP